MQICNNISNPKATPQNNKRAKKRIINIAII